MIAIMLLNPSLCPLRCFYLSGFCVMGALASMSGQPVSNWFTYTDVVNCGTCEPGE